MVCPRSYSKAVTAPKSAESQSPALIVGHPSFVSSPHLIAPTRLVSHGESDPQPSSSAKQPSSLTMCPPEVLGNPPMEQNCQRIHLNHLHLLFLGAGGISSRKGAWVSIPTPQQALAATKGLGVAWHKLEHTRGCCILCWDLDQPPRSPNIGGVHKVT